MLIRQISEHNNSIGPSLEDDLIALNYLAFARCVAGYEVDGTVRYISVDKTLDVYKLHDRNYIEYAEYKEGYKRQKSMKKRQIKILCPIKLYNVETGEEHIFETQFDACKFLSLSRSGLSHLLRKNGTSKSGWKAEYYEVRGDI